jgi:hypothetical protein
MMDERRKDSVPMREERFSGCSYERQVNGAYSCSSEKKLGRAASVQLA